MNRFKYISLFSGAGGLDIGLERAGLQSVSLCDIEKSFCQTLIENKGFTHDDGCTYFKNAKIYVADIKSLYGHDLSKGQSIDLVVGGPPCQSFSSSGKQLSVLDARGSLIHDFFRIINDLQPKMFLFENVRELVTARDQIGEPGGVIRDLLDNFGYDGIAD